MKSHTKLKLRFRWLILLGSAVAGLGLANAPAEETTVEIVHYFNVRRSDRRLGSIAEGLRSR